MPEARCAAVREPLVAAGKAVRGGAEIVEIDVEVELVQYPVHDSARWSAWPCGSWCPTTPLAGPDVLAVPATFPGNGPTSESQMVRLAEELCLYELPFVTFGLSGRPPGSSPESRLASPNSSW